MFVFRKAFLFLVRLFAKKKSNSFLIPHARYRAWHPSPPHNKIMRTESADAHHIGLTQKPAKIHVVSCLLTGDGNEPYSGRFIIDHSYGKFIRDNS